MPLYEYECIEHGVFDLQRPLSEFERTGECPSCRRESLRILSAPRLALVSTPERIARDRNDKSRSEPAVVTRQQPRPSGTELRGSTGHPWALGHG